MKLPVIPASAFGIVLGTAGLSNSWRAASDLWHLNENIGLFIGWIATLIWAALILLYAAKWGCLRKTAQEELYHPIQGCFTGLIGVATMLIAGIQQTYAAAIAQILFWIGALVTITFAVWRTGLLWQGGRDPSSTTAAMYLPLVAGSFVIATVGSALGYPSFGQLAFGAGFFSWLAIESVLLHRLLTTLQMPQQLRPTLGIQMAPPAVGLVAYLSVTTGTPDIFAHSMLGYALLQTLVLLRIMPWIFQQNFAASYWAFTFGIASLSTGTIKLVQHGDTDITVFLAPVLFVFANIAITLIAVCSIVLLAQGKLFPTQQVPPHKS